MPTHSLPPIPLLPMKTIQNAMACALALACSTTAAHAQRWTQGQLSEARNRLTAEAVAGRAVFIGGDVGSSTPSDRIDFYDPSTGIWTQSQLGLGRYSLASTVNGTTLAVAGGINPSGNPASRVDFYDANTDTWSFDFLSARRYALSAASVGTKMLFAGGRNNAMSNRVDIYDTVTGNWSFASLSQSRGWMGCVTVGDKVIFAGGWNGFGPSSQVDIYDDSTGTWSTSMLSVPRYYLGAAVSDGKAVFAGGATGTTIAVSLDTVDIYDPATGVWTTSQLAAPRDSMASVSAQDKAYFYGGFETGMSPISSNRLESFDAATGTWTNANFGTPRGDLAGAVVGGSLVFGGGIGTNGNSADAEIGEFPFGSAYCAAPAANSAGLFAELDAYGSDDASLNNLVIEGSGLPASAFALFLLSDTQGNTPNVGGGAGTLCLGGPIGRFNGQVQMSDPMGRIELDVNTSAVPHPTQGTVSILAGQTWNFQAWYRDVVGGTASSNLTGALSVTFQ